MLPIPPKREQPQKDSCWRGLKPIQNRKILFRNNFHPMSFERASRGNQYLIFVRALESCFIQTNLLVFQLSALVGLSSKMIELRLKMSWMVFFFWETMWKFTKDFLHILSLLPGLVYFYRCDQSSLVYILMANGIPGDIYSFLGIAVLEFRIILEWQGNKAILIQNNLKLFELLLFR